MNAKGKRTKGGHDSRPRFHRTAPYPRRRGNKFSKQKRLASQKGADATTYQMRKEQLKKRDLVRVKQSGTMPRNDDMVTEQVP